MKRRGFLQLLLGAPAVAVLPKLPLTTVTTASMAPLGFGMAAIKAEGKPIITSLNSKALWPGVNTWWKDTYENEFPNEVFK